WLGCRLERRLRRGRRRRRLRRRRRDRGRDREGLWRSDARLARDPVGERAVARRDRAVRGVDRERDGEVSLPEGDLAARLLERGRLLEPGDRGGVAARA